MGTRGESSKLFSFPFPKGKKGKKQPIGKGKGAGESREERSEEQKQANPLGNERKRPRKRRDPERDEKPFKAPQLSLPKEPQVLSCPVGTVKKWDQP
jgi:hypothetical protein